MDVQRHEDEDDLLERNPGMPLSLDLVEAVQVNTSAVERRAATLFKRRSVKKQWQAAWLLKAITMIDLTTLSGDDTPSNVRRLCAKARTPLRHDLIEALGVQELPIALRRGLRLPRDGGDGGPRARGQRHPGGRGLDGLPGRSLALAAAARGDPRLGRRRRPRDRHRGQPPPRAPARLAGALRRGRRLPRGLRRRAHEDDPRHRRARHAAQRRARLVGGDDGRLRLHQDLDRQGVRSTRPSSSAW